MNFRSCWGGEREEGMFFFLLAFYHDLVLEALV